MIPAPPWLEVQADGVRLRLKIVPRAARNEIAEALGDRLKVRIAAPPVDSAANGELVAFLARQLGVARGAVQITRGQASRNKTLVVRGMTAERLLAVLAGRS